MSIVLIASPFLHSHQSISSVARIVSESLAGARLNMSRRVAPISIVPLIIALVIASLAPFGAWAQAGKNWTQSGMLRCRLNPSIGFVIFGHQSMECRFMPSVSGPPQRYEGALNTVGIDVGVIGGGGLAWAVLAPTSGVAAGALAGEYVGASGDIALGAGVGANVLIGGSQRSIALQPVSVEGSVALDVTLGLSALQLRYVP
jgi:hypothetical protein